MAAKLDRPPLIHRYGYQLAGHRTTLLTTVFPWPGSLNAVCERDGFT